MTGSKRPTADSDLDRIAGALMRLRQLARYDRSAYVADSRALADGALDALERVWERIDCLAANAPVDRDLAHRRDRG